MKHTVFKGIATAMGFCTEHLRLPLMPMEQPNREKLLAQMRALEVL